MQRKMVLAAVMVCGLVGITLASAQQQSGASDAAHNDDVKAALSAYRHGNYSPILKILQPRAAKGDTGARTVLGLIYEDGKEVPQDDAKAANLFGQAALAGSPPVAEEQLGILYFQGRIRGTREPVVGYALSEQALKNQKTREVYV